MKRRVHLQRAVAPLLLCAAALGQNPLRITTRIIEIDVAVTDGKGRPVEGLTQDDFTVTENGKQQKIANFSVQDLRIPPPKLITLPTYIFTNRPDLLGIGRSRVTIVLFDLLNMRPADSVYCRQELAKFLREQVRPGDRIAIYTLSSQLRVLHEFTDDASELVKAAAGVQGNSVLQEFLAHGSDPASTAGIKIAQFRSLDRVRLTMAALEAIVNRVAGLPGRKNLVWISTGFPFSTIDTYDAVRRAPMPTVSERAPLTTAPRTGGPAIPPPNNSEYHTFGPEIQRIARAMNTASVAMFCVDGQGLTPPGAAPAAALRGFQSRRETMRTFADSTGGRAFFDGNDIGGSINQAIDESRFTYVVSYYPSHGRWDGHFQEVKVTVNHRGVVVRHRPGYLAIPEKHDTNENTEDREAALLAAIASPLEQTGIRMVVGLTRNMPTAGRLTLRLTIDPGDVQLVEKDGRWTGRLDTAYVQQSSPQKAAGISRDRYNFDFEPDMYARIKEKGLIIEKELGTAASSYRMKVVVRDVSTGAAGSVEVRPINPAGAPN